MRYHYITGTSRGIGKALAEALLQDPQNHVIGLARSCSITHPRYKHIEMDLSQTETVKAFRFQDHSPATQITLINNAGLLSETHYLGRLSADLLEKDLVVNLVAPALLMNTFLATYAETPCEKIIVNVSTGAAQHPIDGRSAYCSAKAGLDMITRVAEEENKHTASKYPCYFFAIAPGIVDTDMQTDIRSADVREFSRLAEFQAYKNQGQLDDPHNVAKKFAKVLANPSQIQKVVFRLSEI